jgi:hypothetical protein
MSDQPTFGRYLSQWFTAAFSPAWNVFGAFGVLVGGSLWVWHRVSPSSFDSTAQYFSLSPDAAMTDLIWIIPFWLGVAVFIYRFVRAPYEIHLKSIGVIEELINERDAVLSQLHSRTKECVAKARDAFQAGCRLKNDVPGAIRDTPKEILEEWKNKARQWTKDTTAVLETCSSMAALKFGGKLGIDVSGGPFFNVHNDLQSQFDYLRQRVDILDEIIAKQDVYFR